MRPSFYRQSSLLAFPAGVARVGPMDESEWEMSRSFAAHFHARPEEMVVEKSDVEARAWLWCAEAGLHVMLAYGRPFGQGSAEFDAVKSASATS